MVLIVKKSIERLSNSKLYSVLKFAIAIILIYLLLKEVNLENTKSIFLSSKLFRLAEYTSILLLIIFISTLKYFFVFLKYESNISLLKLIKTNWIGLFINNFVPGGLGMDAYRYLVFKELISKIDSTKLIILLIVDKVIGILVFIFLSFILGYNLFIEFFHSYLLISIIVIIIISLILAIFYFFQKEKVLSIMNSLFSIGIIPAGIMIFCQLIIVILMIAAYQSLFSAIQIDIAYFELSKFVPLISLGDYIPLTINGIGIREGISVFLFKKINISSENTLVQTFIGRILGILVSIIGGIMYLYDILTVKKKN